MTFQSEPSKLGEKDGGTIMDNWTKKVTEIGPSMMTEEARRKRLTVILKGNTIDCEALAFLIDECADAAGLLLEEHGDMLGAGESENIIKSLGKISGSKAVVSSDPDELIEWVLKMKERV